MTNLTELELLTHNNHHTDAAALLAAYAKHGDSITLCQIVRDAHNRLGHLPRPLVELRSGAIARSLAAIAARDGQQAADTISRAL